MRLWLRESERRPNPAPAQTDDRAPIITGLIAWIVGLVVLLSAPTLFGIDVPTMWLWSCIAGIVLGTLGLTYAQLRR